MIQFFGLSIHAKSARAIALGKDLSISARSEAGVLGAEADPETGTYAVSVAEWVRAGSLALEEAFFKLPPAKRKPWGVGLAGPCGWIALDVDFKPLSPLRITGERGPEEDLRRWRAEDPKRARKVAMLLSPKDYLRFVLTGGLAADVTTASRSGLLDGSRSQWSEAKIHDASLQTKWMPPVFDGHVTTGRMSEEGIRRTSIPGGTWFVAGTHEVEAALLALGDLRDETLRILPPSEARGWLLALGAPNPAPSIPAGWQVYRSPIEGHSLLEKTCPAAPSGSDSAEELSRVTAEARSELEAVGFRVSSVLVAGSADSPIEPERGAAALAAVGSGLVKGWDRYFSAGARRR